MKIIVAENISPKGIDKLREAGYEVDFCPKISREELLSVIDKYDGLIVRSVTQVNEELYEAAENLKVVGRAGNGVDNIQMEGASKRGIIVVNTPNANTTTTAEHTIALLLASDRRIPQADAMIRRGEWDRSKHKGTEIFGKTLGIIGLGRIGSKVATRMAAFGVKLIGYDPYITDERFAQFNVERCQTLDELVKQSDFITIHTPRNEETINIISDREFELAKDGVRVVNCARGGLINEDALFRALERGKVASAAIDVLMEEPAVNTPLLKNEKCIFTPHLGASTNEAQDNVGITVAEEVINVLSGGIVPDAVNMPQLENGELETLYDYLYLGEDLGALQKSIFEGHIGGVRITFNGEAAAHNIDTMTRAVLTGLLTGIKKDILVNYVNADIVAQNLGITVEVVEGNKTGTNSIDVRVSGPDDSHCVVGTVVAEGEYQITAIDKHSFSITPAENMIVIKNDNTPGAIGHVGMELGEQLVNIDAMQCSPVDGTAIMILSVDSQMTDNALDSLRSINGIKKVAYVAFNHAK